ncbi:hypothetical protein [Umezawaea beigongshangensis]|uniref:hypothetical protein n=1 Tax=Umezawaea beigongshangensis TaxID=2780383 RepID=UPI0018F12E2A|nr:hypothetical protein [Umezawaea beigongshangensis]
MSETSAQPTAEQDVHAQLAELGLRLTHLDRATWAGVNARSSAPQLGPTNGPGLLDWIHRVGSLRELLVAEGWSRLDKYNAGLVRHPDKPIVLGTLQGNRNTGDVSAALRSDYAKGPAITAMMRDNDHDQLGLFDAADEHDGLKLWFLVTYPVQREDGLTVLREVSMPEPTPRGQVIDRWAHRIPLPPVEFTRVAPPLFSDAPREVDFAVVLKR